LYLLFKFFNSSRSVHFSSIDKKCHKLNEPFENELLFFVQLFYLREKRNNGTLKNPQHSQHSQHSQQQQQQQQQQQIRE
jgi:hypothetical protein